MGSQESWERLIRRHGGLITAPEAARAGITPDRIRWALRSGRLHAIRRGAYTMSDAWQAFSPANRHRLELAACQRLTPQAVVCGESAALVHGLPVPGWVPEQPQLIIPRPATGGARGRRGGTLQKSARLAPDEVQTVQGLRVTTPLRTVLDCARTLPETWGLAVADDARNRFGLRRDTLIDAVQALPMMPGLVKARWVAETSRKGVESPLESLARGLIVLAGLPRPRVQVGVQTVRGHFRVDLCDIENGLITEADGRIKYGTPEDVWAEKLREDALRERTFEVNRFTMADHARPEAWLAGYRRALDRCALRPTPRLRLP